MENGKREIALIVHDVRSTHNVGSLFRTADGLGVVKIILSGYTPYPALANDKRLPHIAKRVDKQIAKTALGATKTISWQYSPSLEPAIEQLKADGYMIVALEQTPSSLELSEFRPPDKVVLLVGNEVAGLSREHTALSHQLVMIPMLGRKESFNVTVAAAIALYHLRYIDKKPPSV